MGNEKKRFGGKSGCCVAMQVIQMLSTELEQAHGQQKNREVSSMVSDPWDERCIYLYIYHKDQRNVGKHNPDLP